MPMSFARRSSASLFSFVAAPARLTACAMLALGAIATMATSCGDSDGGNTGGAGGAVGGGGVEIICNGGIIVDGECVAKCDPALCVENNICVNNQCALACTSHADCAAGQACSAAIQDDTGAEVSVCRLTPKTGFAGQPCPFGTECGGITVCPTGEACGASLCGGQACNPVPEYCPPDQPDCGLGLCPDNATLCYVQTCAPEACREMRCTGIGEGDAEAFCTYDHCQADADCPSGYYCGVARDPHNICGTSKGTTQPCVEPATFADNGQTFQEGPVSLLKNSCLPRPLCAPCATNLDCSLTPGQVCADLSGEMRCTETCSEANTDCRTDFECDIVAGICRPRFGQCIGAGELCHPCLNDLDCGGGTKVCRTDILVDGQRACHDSAFPDSCTTDANCPTAPSGLSGECLDAGEGVQPGDSVYQKCFFPFNPAPPGDFTCWP